MQNADKMIDLLDQLNVVKKDFQHLQDKQKIISAEFTTVIFKEIQPVYERWRPRINERAFFVDFEAQIFFQVKVVSIDGYYVRTQPISPDNTAYYGVELNTLLEDIVNPTFIIPELLFKNMYFNLKLTEIYTGSLAHGTYPPS